MHNSISRSLLIVLLLLSSITGFTQLRLSLGDKLVMPSSLSLSGELSFVNDSVILLGANGGLYSYKSKGWFYYPDSVNYLTSFVPRESFQDIIYSTYNVDTDSFYLLWQYRVNDTAYIDTIARIDSCICLAKYSANTIYVYGYKKDNFVALFLDSSTLYDIFNIDIHPSDIQFYSETTIYISVENHILILNKNTGARKLLSIPNTMKIESFSKTSDTDLIFTTQDGLYHYSFGNSEPNKLFDNINGVIHTRKEKVYVVNTIDNSITTLSFE